MSGIMRIGLRLVGTTRYIPNNNTTKYLQPMCHVRNGFIHVPKNSFTSAQKESAGFGEKLYDTLKTLCFFMIPITIIFTYKNMPEFLKAFRLVLHDTIAAAEKETMMYSIIPSTIVTSSVLFDDNEIQIKTQKDNIRLMNDNTQIFMGSKEMDASILKPFPKGKPITIKIGKLNGLLDNGKLTLTTEDSDTTFTFHNTVGLEVKKLSDTLQNEKAANKEKQHETIPSRISYSFLGSKTTLKTPESELKWNLKEVDSNLPYKNEIIPIIGKLSLSCDTKVKIPKDKSDEAHYFTQMVHLECDKKLDKNTQNEIATKIKSCHEITEEMKICDVIIDSGIVVFSAHNCRRRAVRQVLTCEIFEDGKQAYLKWTQRLSDIDGLNLHLEYH